MSAEPQTIQRARPRNGNYNDIGFEEAGFIDIPHDDVMRMRWQPEGVLLSLYLKWTARSMVNTSDGVVLRRSDKLTPLMDDDAARMIISTLSGALNPAVSLAHLDNDFSKKMAAEICKSLLVYLGSEHPSMPASHKSAIMATCEGVLFSQFSRATGRESKASRTNLQERRDEASYETNTGGSIFSGLRKNRQSEGGEFR